VIAKQLFTNYEIDHTGAGSYGRFLCKLVFLRDQGSCLSAYFMVYSILMKVFPGHNQDSNNGLKPD